MSSVRYAIVLVLAFLIAGCQPKIVIQPVPTGKTAASAPGIGPSPEQRFSEAENLYQQKRFARAIAAYLAFARDYPDNEMAPAALMKAGSAESALSDYTAARDTYRRLLDRYPDSAFVPDATIEWLASFYNGGEFARLLAAAGPVVDQFKNDPQRLLRLYALMGDAHMALEKPVEAAWNYYQADRLAQPPATDQLMDKLRQALRLLTREQLLQLTDRIHDPNEAKRILALGRSLIYHRYSIGCLLPLSGPYQAFGQRALDGIEFALYRMKASGGSPLLDLVIRDSAGDPARAAAAVNDMADAGVAAIIGPIVTAPQAAAAAQRQGVPIMTLTQNASVCDTGDFVFRNFITVDAQVAELVDHATRVLHLRRFAVLYPDEPYGREALDAFWDAAERDGARIVGVQSYSPGLTDFAEPIKRLVGRLDPVPQALIDRLNPLAPAQGPAVRFPNHGGDILGLYFPLPASLSPPADNPPPPALPDALTARSEGDNELPSIVDFDALFIPDAPRTAGLIIPQLAFYDVRRPLLMGTNLWHSDTLLSMCHDYVQGAMFPDGFFADSAQPIVQDFVNRFDQIYGRKPGLIEAEAYDSAELLMQIVSRPDIQSRNAVRDALTATTGFNGVTGRTAFDADGDVHKIPFLITFKGNALVQVDTDPGPFSQPVTGPATTTP